MSTTQVVTENTLLSATRNSCSKDGCMKLYDKWAATYNVDLADASQNYVAPILVAQAAIKFGSPATASILDAGCGTGLVGEALRQGSGARNIRIDGADLSPAMLREAEQTGVYRDLLLADLTRCIEKPDETYDIVTCCGTFTHGHVGPDPALREFVRLTRGGGLVIATILDEIWISGGFHTEVKRLEAEGLVRIVSLELRDYRKGQGDKATLVVLKKLGSV